MVHRIIELFIILEVDDISITDIMKDLNFSGCEIRKFSIEECDIKESDK